ncbi:MAG: thermonuclease family protein [bacterium]|nr:thermonuclease family protein [bacterium]
MLKKYLYLICLSFLIFTLPQCSQKEYPVKNIIDGDTIELENGEKIRYIGLDTPETRIKQKDGTWLYQPQAYAEKAKEFNRKLVEGKRIRLEYDMVQKDKYNRSLAYVFAGDTFVNAELIRQGYALLFTMPPNVKYIDHFIKLQKEARENKRGLWSEINDEPVFPENAHNYAGKVIYIKGKVLDVYEGRNIVILNFGKNKKDFKAVIFKNNLTLFINRDIYPVKGYLSKQVRIYGKIKMYKDAPEIILDVPDQIEIMPDLD